MRRHWVIDVKSKSSLSIGSVCHTDKEKDNRINELLECGIKRKNIIVNLYIAD